ncbi:hypothetical protein ABZ915_39425 [Streptomyces sp. NPDC046915]|uniref:hypothetical protein n=1 Tax=Streptomyces sp. NPDC046915 TaxID=3155257 RepID=UPI0033F3C131
MSGPPAVGDRRPVPGFPVLVFRLQQVVAHEPGDQGGVAVRAEPQQHPLVICAFLGGLAQVRGLGGGAVQAILRDGEHLNSPLVVRAQPGQHLDQRPVRHRVGHVLLGLVGAQEDGHDQGGELPLTGLLP